MKNARVVLLAALVFLFCTGTVALAQDEPPPTPPAETGDIGGAGVEEAPAPAPQTVAEVSAPPSTPAEAAPPPEEAKAEPPAWRAVVDSMRPSYWEASILPLQGLAMYYNPGVFQQVLDFRFAHNHITPCDDCIGFVALLRGGDLDRRVWLKREGLLPEGPFWVVDAAALKHVPGLLSRNWVVDIDYQTAMRWRMAGPIPITVYDNDSPEARAAAAAHFASETIPLDERHIIPPEAYSYRNLDEEMEPPQSRKPNSPVAQGYVSPSVDTPSSNHWID